jgi:uncharacterized protein (DUF58 family)
MSVTATSNPGADAAWHGPAGSPVSRGFSWKRLLWAMVFPVKRHRISVTVPGLFLIAVSMGIGMAAYNTASNILFITLSLLLACLLLSGLLSWFNFRGVRWRLRPAAAWRAGHETLVTVETENTKKWLPTYGLWFDVATQPRAVEAAADDTKDMKVREILEAAEKAITRGRLFLRERLEPRGTAAIEWVHKPERRGEAVLELEGVGSFFPFGFLRKNIGAGLRHRVLVWPAQVDYQWRGAATVQAGSQGQRTVRAGTGEDLLALRKYAQGDSHRLIHWKASARLGQLMVRQFAAESLDGFAIRLDTPADVWSRPEQFELLCSFAGTLAEDLFAQGRLRAIRINGGAWFETRRVRDVEAFLDQLALLVPISPETATPETGDRNAGTRGFSASGVRTSGLRDENRLRTSGVRIERNLITFAPDGARGVTAYVDGSPTASA